MKVKLGDYVLMVQEREVLKKVDTSKYVSTENILADRNGVKFPANTIPLSKTITTYKKDDILISNIRPYFKKIWKAEFDGPKSNDVIAFRTKDSRLLQDYLYVVLQSDNFFNYVTNTAKGTKMPRGDKKAIINYEFELPNIQLQRKISHTILVLEKKIRLNNQINDNLMKLNTLLFQQLSVDSDYTLSNFTDCQNGFAFKSSEYITNNELLILRTLNMTSDHLFSKNGVKYISKVYKEKYQKFEFKKFDTTLVMVGASIGKMALITTNVIPSLQNQNMWRFRSKSKMPGLLIYDMVQYVNDRVRSSATGSARSFYRKKMFLNSKVPVISEKYYDIFLAIQEKINNIANENETLSNLKNVLLSKYF